MKLIFIFLFNVAAISMADSDNDVQELFRTASNQFTSRMFTEVVKKNPGKSVVLSAFSVMTPLAQLAAASVSETHDEILECMGLPNDNVTKAAFLSINSRLKSAKGIELRMASNIYIRLNDELNSEFAALSKEVFNSGVKNVDFTKNVDTAKEINTWVEDQTNNRIKDLVDPNSLSGDTRAVLVNAIYFKGLWKYPFRKMATYESDFHVSKDKVIKVQMMYQKETFKYAESKELKAQLLEMPYEGEESSLLIILPNEIDGITELEEKLKDPTVLDKVAKNMRKEEVQVYIPKFKIETTTNLKKVLQKMKVERMFTPMARLDKLLSHPENLYVSEAIQKAFIEVNEEGAEAAAGNVIKTTYKVRRKQFRANRPFYYAIKMNSTLLFNGVKSIE